MVFWQFSNLIIYVQIVVKIPDQHLNVCLFSNPGDKDQNRWRTTGQICPVLSTRLWTLSPGLDSNHTLKCWSGIFLTILTYMIMLENYQNNISVYGWSPIQGTRLYSCWNLMKPGSQSGTYEWHPSPVFRQPFTKRSWAGMQLVAAYWAGNHFCYQLLMLPLSLYKWVITKSWIFNLAQICANEAASNLNN